MLGAAVMLAAQEAMGPTGAAAQPASGAPLPEGAVRDTIAAVFAAPEYNPGLNATLAAKFWELVLRFLSWLDRLLSPVGEAAGRSVALRIVMILILAVAIGAVAWRIAYAFYLRRGHGLGIGLSARGMRFGRGGQDAWTAAQEAARRGDFTAAAHALYEALLQAIARRGEVRLHPSKTVGDYGRELRGRSSSLFGRYREFARAYEVVIYGLGSCDRARYERLYALAAPVVRPEPAPGQG